MMTPKFLMVSAGVACLLTAPLFAQVDCATSKDLICELPISASTLANVTVGAPTGSGPAFNKALSTAFPINAAIASQISQLPIPSASVGVVSLRQQGSEVGVPFDNLGPILTDRPDTVGKGHIFIGGSFQHFHFNSIDGTSLGALPVAFSYTQPSPFNASDQQTVYGGVYNNVLFRLNQWTGILTYGATRTTDVTVVVPINAVSVNVTASKIQAYVFDSVKNQYSSVPAPTASLTTTGTASGIGDILINVKQLLVGQEGERVAVSAGGNLRAPTGKASNYLGSGAFGGQVYGLLEYRHKIAPHVRVAYQWNGVSSDLAPPGAAKIRLPGGLLYDIGSDFRLARTLSVDVDLLGNQFVNSPSLAPGKVTLLPASDPTPPVASIATVNTFTRTYTTVNFSGGAKWAPVPHFLIFANLLKQTNSAGLRSDVVPLVGIAYHR
jgi:hypothetical protein